MMKTVTDTEYTIIYDGSKFPSVTYATISKYKDLPLTITTYMFQVYAMNIVGTSVASPVLSITIDNTAYAGNSLLSGSALSSFPANRLVNLNLQVN